VTSGGPRVIRSLLHSLLYFPSRGIAETPDGAGLDYLDLELETEDGELLHGWWIGAQSEASGHLLLCHGNAGNVGDRVLHAALLTAAGFDVLLFDYRGYGRSSGRPSEEGTYRDARAALRRLLKQPGVDPGRVVYLGESLGGAVALDLALDRPPLALVLLSAFTGVRELGRLHYPFVPASVVPDAYPALRRIHELDAPLLVLHGDRDEIVPLSHARALFQAAPGPKRVHVFAGRGHNDLVPLAGSELARTVASWVSAVDRRRPRRYSTDGAERRQAMKDLTLILDDRPGALAELGDATGGADINIEGMCATTGGGKGEVHILVEDAAAARDALAGVGIDVSGERDVLVVEVENRPGTMAAAARRFADAGVNVEFAYSTFGGVKLVLGVDDLDKARGAA
jgi:uncharacterized protein